MTTGHHQGKEARMRLRWILGALAIATAPIACSRPARPTPRTAKKPNILFIMGDDVGWLEHRRVPSPDAGTGLLQPRGGQGADRRDAEEQGSGQ